MRTLIIPVMRAAYDAVRREVKWETDRAPGGLLHVCGFDSAGNLHVTDVWESEELMNAFVGARLIPGFKKVGVPMPDVAVFPMHNVNLYPDAARFLLK
jgi:hypothetical protein